MLKPVTKPSLLFELGMLENLAKSRVAPTFTTVDNSFVQGDLQQPASNDILSASRSILTRTTAESKTAPINIRDIRSEAELLSYLSRGFRVIAYRGFTAEHLPEIGEPYDSPYIDKLKRGSSASPLEAAIERMRREHFPNMPGRMSSVFAANSPAEAKLFGKVYELELSLRPNASIDEGNQPLRWLHRGYYERLVDLVMMGGAELPVEMIMGYLGSRGGHGFPSDILLDPQLIEIVVREYKPSQQEIIGDIVDCMFRRDPMSGYAPPFDAEDVIEQLEERFSPIEGVPMDLVRKAAMKRLVMVMLDELPAKYLHYSPQELIDNNVRVFLWQPGEIRRIIAEEQPFADESDPDYQRVLSVLKKYDDLLTDH